MFFSEASEDKSSLSADEIISISIEDQELEEVLTRLDAALAKKEQLTGFTPTVTGESETQETGGVASIVGAGEADFSAFWARLDSEVTDAKTLVDDTVADGEAKLAMLKAKTVTAKIEATNLLTNEAPKIKDLEQAAKRIASMIPGLREASRLQTALKSLSTGNTLVAIISILMLVLSIYRQIVSMLEEQKRREEEYRRQVMQLRGFTTIKEFEAWQNSQRQAQEQWRSQSPTIVS